MLPWLIACAPGPFSAEEAEVVYEGVSSVNADVYATLYAFSAPTEGEDPGLSDGSAKGLTLHTAADGGDFSGTVDGPGSWSGTVELAGDYTVTFVDLDTWTILWSVDETYVGVDYGDVTLDGDIRWDLRAEIDGSAFTHTSTIDGDMVARGLATGEGALSYATTVSLSGGRYLVRTEGTVGEQDISTEYDATAFGL